MARVQFTRPWFGPNGKKYDREDNFMDARHWVAEVPDEYIPLLPSSARVLDHGAPEPPQHSHDVQEVALGDLAKPGAAFADAMQVPKISSADRMAQARKTLTLKKD